MVKTFVKALLEEGCVLAPELYFCTLPTEKQAKEYLEAHLKQVMSKWKSDFPGNEFFSRPLCVLPGTPGSGVLEKMPGNYGFGKHAQ